MFEKIRNGKALDITLIPYTSLIWNYVLRTVIGEQIIEQVYIQEKFICCKSHTPKVFHYLPIHFHNLQLKYKFNYINTWSIN